VRALTIWLSWEIVVLYAATVALYVGVTGFLLAILVRDGHRAVVAGVGPFVVMTWLGIGWQFAHVLRISREMRASLR
jgi:hypothetical protein